MDARPFDQVHYEVARQFELDEQANEYTKPRPTVVAMHEAGIARYQELIRESSQDEKHLHRMHDWHLACRDLALEGLAALGAQSLSRSLAHQVPIATMSASSRENDASERAYR